jgi:protein-disulfide isomerase
MTQRPEPCAGAGARGRLPLALPLLALLGLACAGASSRSPAPEAQLAARVAGRDITVGEVDQRVRDDLFARETRGNASRLYEVRASALDRMIEEALLEQESARRGTTPEQLRQEQAAAAASVPDQEVAAFYAQHAQQMGGATLEQVGPRIRDHLAAQRAQEQLDALRERSDVHVYLVRPRLDVAATGPSLGPAGARVTIIEFADFQCPFCQRANPVLKEVLARYPEDVRVVYRQLPLDGLHPRARAAAEASLCADDQDRFWPYHDRLYENPKALSPDDLVAHASALGLDLEQFRRCVAERTHRERVQEDAQAAAAAGISGTPAFLVNGILLSGARPASAFVQLIDEELARK